MNETIKTILERRSCRSYTDQIVSDELLNQIGLAGSYAASGKNKQSASIIIVKDKKILEEFRRIGTTLRESDPFYGCNNLILVFASPKSPLYIQDGSLVLGNMMLAATSLGLGSCWINCIQDILNSNDGAILRKKLQIENDLVAIGSCIVGYPKEIPAVKPRKDDYIRMI